MEPGIDRSAARDALERILASEGFQRAGRSSALLRFLVEETLEGRVEDLKEYTIGTAALGRPASFDPRTDTIVRAEASRLRGRLERYYSGEGGNDPFVLVLPKGSYVIRFTRRATAAVPEASGEGWSAKRITFGWIVPPAAVVVIALVTLAVQSLRQAPGSAAPVARFDVELRSDGTLGSSVGTDVILTPDGSRVIFTAADGDGLAHLYSLRLDALDRPGATRVSGSAGARSAFASPDGRWVGYWANGRILKAPLDGGDPIQLAETPDLTGASWGEDGWIVAAMPGGRLWRLSDAGGAPSVLLDLAEERAFPHWPQVVDRDLIVYTVMTGDADSARVEVMTPSDRRRTTLVRGGTFGRILAGGYLTFVNQGTLYATRFDRRRLALEGPRVSVLQDVSYSRTFGYAQLDVSRSGLLAYRGDPAGGLRVIDRIDAAGRRTPLLPEPGRYLWPSLSPDGGRLAFSVTSGGRAEIGVYDLVRRDLRRIRTASADHSGLGWTPGGDRLLFGGTTGLMSIGLDEGAEARPLGDDRGLAVPWSVSPDGRLAFQRMSPETAFDLWTAPLGRESAHLTIGEASLFLRTPAMDAMPSWSADGRWLAYVSRASGRPLVFVRSYPDDGTVTQVSADPGTNPRWSADGRQLFFQALDGSVMAAAWTVVDGRFAVGSPRYWARQVLADVGVLPAFDAAPDGVVALVSAGGKTEATTSNHVTFLLNFVDELRRRVR